MPDVISQIYQLFFYKQSGKLITLIAVMALMSLAQIVSVALIMPFMELIFDPEITSQNGFIGTLFKALPSLGVQDFTLVFGLIVLTALVLSNAFLAFSTWFMANFTWQAQLGLSQQLLQKYLQYDYESFTRLNSADILKNILFESAQVTTGALMPILNMVAFGFTSICIVAFLLWVNLAVTSVIALSLGVCYWIAYLTVKTPLQHSGAKRIESNMQRYKVVNEALGGLKEIKLLGLESECQHHFHAAAQQFSRANIVQATASQIPKYVIEAIALCFLVGGLLLLTYGQQPLEEILPLVSVYALAAFRLLPALQKVFTAISTIKFNREALHTVYEVHQRADVAAPNPAPKGKALPFLDKIKLNSVNYRYPEAENNSLQALSLTIHSGQLVAFIGSTGAGKSTIADIIMGLLTPNSGTITIDGNALGENNMACWQAQIGYVPQDIYLVDKSIAENIAFGDHDFRQHGAAIEDAARSAQIDEFIQQDLPQGYDTIVGERGIRLSGGQKQRIGIARALYRNPKILVLDEATSALDQRTEKAVHEAILNIAKHKTVILIAHRLSTVKDCDRIFLLEKGELAATGSFNELMTSNELFKQLAAEQKTTSS